MSAELKLPSDDVSATVRALESELRPLRALMLRVQDRQHLRHDVKDLRSEQVRLQTECARAEGALQEARLRLTRAQSALKQHSGWIPSSLIQTLSSTRNGPSWRKQLRLRTLLKGWAAFAVFCLLLCVLLDWVRAVG